MPPKFSKLACLAGLAFLTLIPSPLPAFQADDDAQVYEVDRRGAEKSTRHPAAQSRLSRGAAWTDYLGRHAGWVAEWNDPRERLVKAYGPAAPVPGAGLLSESAAIVRARDFLAREMAPWLPADSDLEFVKGAAHGSGRWLHFTQTHDGIPVFNSRVTVRMTNDGRITQVTNLAYPRLDVSTRPAVSANRATTLGAEGLPAGVEPLKFPELTILPVERATGDIFHLAWRVEFSTVTPPGHWITFVDAATGAILWRFNNVRFADVTGTIGADIELERQNDIFVERGLQYIDARVTSATDTTSSTSDVLGAYLVTTPDSLGRTIRVRLAGPFGRVFNVAIPDTPTTPSITISVPNQGSAFRAFYFDNGNSLASERDAYYNAMIAHDYIKTVEPGFNALDYQMPIAVEVAGSCNAFWNGFGVNFFVEDTRCTNTARSATTVMHEYGHGITDFIYRPFFPSGAMHEGFSDYYAATITNQPIVGLGFRKSDPNSYIRRIDDDRISPDDLTGEVHNDGLVIASALWNIREGLGREKTDELWHFARYGLADNYDDYVFDVLETDDDDGNVYNGTPNFTFLANTFRHHGIGDYAVHISHVPTPDTEDTLKVFPITATFLSLYALDETSVKLHARIGLSGQPTVEMEYPMSPAGGIREFSVVIPNQPVGTAVSYYLTATDSTGTSAVFPPDGENHPIVFHIGPDDVPPVIVHSALPDQPIDSPPIRIQAGMTDNLDKSLHSATLIQRTVSMLELASEMEPLGGHLYRSEIPVASLSLGSLVEYRFEAVDSAAIPLTGVLPDTGWFQFHMVKGFARDFEADNGGLTGDGDWEWGDPSLFVPASSGIKVWGTNLGGTYHDMTTSTLALPLADLSGFAKAALTFRQYMDCEVAYDGGVVEASTDQGANWSVLVPDGGYNSPRVVALGRPGFTGLIDWSPVEFDLSQFVGQPDVRLRLQFASDGGVTGPGWYVDDLQIVERQIAVSPLVLRTISGRDGRVPLTWSQPPGVVEGPTSPVTGYNLYRSLSATDEPVRLNAAPLAGRVYADTTVTNGLVYYYYVGALYGAVESRLTGPVGAFPFRSMFSANRASIAAMIDSIGMTNEVVTLTNNGNGPLRTNIYRALPGQDLDDVRIRLTTATFGNAAPPASGNEAPVTQDLEEFIALSSARKAPGRPLLDVAPTGMWDTLFVDAQESVSTPDLATLEVQQTNEFLYFRLTSYNVWANPFVDFNLLIAIDTDGNQSNGFQGGDFALIAGPLVLNAFGAPAMLVNAALTPVEFPHHIILNPATNSAEFGILKSSLGEPAEVRLIAAVTLPSGPVLTDRLPDAPPVPWITTTPRFLQVAAGATGDLAVTLNSAGLPDGDVLADLLLETNDPANPSVRIPVTLTVTGMTPVVLSDFAAVPGAEGLELRWSTAEEVDHLGFHVWRREIAPFLSGESRVNSDLITSGDGTYLFVDAAAEPGRTYAYRLADVSRTGTVTFHGPFSVTVPGDARPDRLWLAPAVPNPTRAQATIRFGVPEAGAVSLRVFNIEGRLVKTLALDEVMPAGFHEKVWDGTSEGGEISASGIYFYRLDAGGKKEIKKLLILR